MKSDSRLPKKLSIRPRMLLSALLAGIVAVLLPHPVHLVARLLCSWDAFTLCFLFLTLRVMLRANPDIMRRFARQEDEGRMMISSLITIAACISIIAIGLILQDKSQENSLFFLHLGLSIFTIVSSWLLVHTIID